MTSDELQTDPNLPELLLEIAFALACNRLQTLTGVNWRERIRYEASVVWRLFPEEEIAALIEQELVKSDDE